MFMRLPETHKVTVVLEKDREYEFRVTEDEYEMFISQLHDNKFAEIFCRETSKTVYFNTDKIEAVHF